MHQIDSWEHVIKVMPDKVKEGVNAAYYAAQRRVENFRKSTEKFPIKFYVDIGYDASPPAFWGTGMPARELVIVKAKVLVLIDYAFLTDERNLPALSYLKDILMLENESNRLD
jgi:hypothetical protein